MDKFLLPVDDDLPMNNWGQWTEIKLFYLERYMILLQKRPDKIGQNLI